MSLARTGCGPVLVLLVGGLGIVLVTPGALVTFVVSMALDLHLDPVQAWTFAAAGSFLLYLFTVSASGGWLTGTGHFFVFSLLCAMTVAVAGLGLRASWPDAFVAMLAGGHAHGR